jgi:hypothetical protein
MKPEQQNKIIAKHCGWKQRDNVSDNYSTNGWLNPNNRWDYCPNFCEDLNAMHEAEKILFETIENPNKYFDELDEICEVIADTITATAAQRAEAFLKTIGKWEDEQ